MPLARAVKKATRISTSGVEIDRHLIADSHSRGPLQTLNWKYLCRQVYFNFSRLYVRRCRPASADDYLIAKALGEVVTMSDDDQLLTHRLRAHVTSLAEEIGERNVFNSEALRRAAAYIEAEWNALGYGVERLEYDVSGVRCANLIATREGSTRGNEILLLGALYLIEVPC